MSKIIFTLSLLGLICLNAKDITVYTYHNHAPFIAGKEMGLSHILVNYLNKSSDTYNFKLKIVPRSRLNYYLKPWIQKKCEQIKKCDQDWMLLWVNHKWGFGKDSLSTFSWIKLFEDSNSIIYSKNKKIDYQNVNSLIGKKIGGIAGHKYVGIDDLVKKGKIIRIDGNNEVSNLQKVIKGRIDATLLPTSSFNYYAKTISQVDMLEKSQIKHQVYMRNIMTTNKNTELTQFLKSLDFQTVLKNHVE